MQETNILIVDDKPDNLMVLESALADLELNCIRARSGEEALGLALDHNLALILLDVQMPDLDGYETARLLKGAQRTRNVPIIMVTAINKDLGHVLKGYSVGAADYLFKPINAEILESKVRVFVELYRQQRIIQTQAVELERRNRELDDFAHFAAHDLKAPLRAVGNLASWIAEDAREVLSAESLRHLETMQDRVRGMTNLLDDVLAYARAEVANDGERTEVDPRRLVQGVVELLAPPERFVVAIEEMPGSFKAPRGPMEQVLHNLIGNAIKHHDREDGRVEIFGRDLGAFLEFRVADDGPGIPVESHERAFQMFQRLQTRPGVDGSGVGLALVKKIVEGRGGTVRLESREPRGTVFRFTWPKERGESFRGRPRGACVTSAMGDGHETPAG